jgi:hypothetical protein
MNERGEELRFKSMFAWQLMLADEMGVIWLIVSCISKWNWSAEKQASASSHEKSVDVDAVSAVSIR